MNSLARKIVLRELKNIKLERKLSASVTLKKNEEFLIKSPLPDIEVPTERFTDRIWKNISGYRDHIALVSVKKKSL